MAVTRDEQTIVMTADEDAVTDKLYIQSLEATGAVGGITNTAGNPIAHFPAAGVITFPKMLLVSGIVRGAGAGELYVHIV